MLVCRLTLGPWPKFWLALKLTPVLKVWLLLKFWPAEMLAEVLKFWFVVKFWLRGAGLLLLLGDCQSCSDLFSLERLDIFRLWFLVGDPLKSDCLCRKLRRLLSDVLMELILCVYTCRLLIKDISLFNRLALLHFSTKSLNFILNNTHTYNHIYSLSVQDYAYCPTLRVEVGYNALVFCWMGSLSFRRGILPFILHICLSWMCIKKHLSFPKKW